ncbi:hypothetical protein EC968_002472 [Mortierella alpina]|nr:hypothetical protein EC968_002472 [Mortierella alpina]
MSNKFYKRNGAPITHNEYCILVNVHRHLSDSGPLQSAYKNATPLKRLTMTTGVETSVAREAIRLSKSRENPPEHNRRDIQTTHDIVIAIRTVFLDRNRDNITFRLITAEYLLQSLQFELFRTSNKPEVYVDESFWTLDQNSRPIRVSQGFGLNKRGQEPMLVVFGAMVVSSNLNKVSSKIVRKSILIWPMRGIGQDLPGSITTNEELWQSVPNTVKKAGIATDFHDGHYYYSDLEDTTWELMFETLCQTLHQDYGSCHIHLDEAQAHMRRENMLPYAVTKVEEVRQWFIENKLPIPTGPKGQPLSKAELVVRALEAKVPPRFACDTIASKHGHTVLKIPRHHYEFQPMEWVWRMGNMSTTAISRTEPELNLRNRLLEVFADLKEERLSQFWWKTHLAAIEHRYVYRDNREIGQVSQGETDSEWSDEGT